MSAATFQKWSQRSHNLGVSFITSYEEFQKTGNVKVRCESGHTSEFVFRSLTAKIGKVEKQEHDHLCVSCSKTGRRPQEEQVKDRCKEFGFTLLSYDKPGRKGVYQCLCGNPEPFANRQLLDHAFRPGCMKCNPLLKRTYFESKQEFPQLVKSLITSTQIETEEEKITFNELSDLYDSVQKENVPVIIYTHESGARKEYHPRFLVNGNTLVEPVRDFDYDRQAPLLWSVLSASNLAFELWVYQKGKLYEIVYFDPETECLSYKFGNRLVPRAGIEVSQTIYSGIISIAKSPQGPLKLYTLLKGIAL